MTCKLGDNQCKQFESYDSRGGGGAEDKTIMSDQAKIIFHTINQVKYIQAFIHTIFSGGF